MKEDEIKAFCYLYQINDEKNKCLLTDKSLVFIINNKEHAFPLTDINHLQVEERRTMLPLIAGGIVIPFSLLAIFTNLTYPWLIIVLFVSGCLSFYSGWLGHRVISVHAKGPIVHDLKIKYASQPLRAFLEFTNEILRQGISEEIRAPNIYHIVRKNDWSKNIFDRYYAPPSLQAEGFIHCSTKLQLNPTIQRLFSGQKDLLILSIDPLKVKPEIKYEPAKDADGLFPHIYGPLNLDSIVKEESLKI
ncbi:hypothetical protein BH23BAC1_BH23BAC1_35130 [soil metagenome]